MSVDHVKVNARPIGLVVVIFMDSIIACDILLTRSFISFENDSSHKIVVTPVAERFYIVNSSYYLKKGFSSVRYDYKLHKG